jgi:DNA-binding NtrC family response regulator
MTARILVVDDETGMQIALREVLQRQGHLVTVAPDATTALGCLESQAFELVLSDVRMPEVSGIELLERIRARWPSLPVVIMTAYGTIEDAVDAMKKGAVDYLLKPFSTETIERLVAHQLSRGPVPSDRADAPAGSSWTATEPVAASPSMRQVLEMTCEIADSMAMVLIQGESGTGKEVVARYLHRHSGRGERPFVAVNCAALPEGLLESELFGHEKGAFTGAVISRKGRFELANRGTLLLDEISEMPLALQAKLLRVLQEREIDPVGSQRPVPLDVRVIATTNRDLAAFVAEGNFREDLFYRLQVITIERPPLRERRDDILPLSEYFLRRHCRVNRRPHKQLSPSMRQYLLAQYWRGNVRELENFLERAVLLCKSDEITPDGIFLGPMRPRRLGASDTETSGPAAATSARTGTDRPAPPHARDWAGPAIIVPDEQITLEEMERRLILQTLDRVGGNRTRAADILGVSVRTIRNKLHHYGLVGYMADRSAAPVAKGAAGAT